MSDQTLTKYRDYSCILTFNTEGLLTANLRLLFDLCLPREGKKDDKSFNLLSDDTLTSSASDWK